MSYRDFETVSSVITRLGQPPSDISALWMEDVRSQCDAQDIPPLDANTTFWQHVVVDDRGRARLQRDDLPLETAPSTPQVVDVDALKKALDSDRPRQSTARKRRHPKLKGAFTLIAVTVLIASLLVSVSLPQTAPPEDDKAQSFAKVGPITKRPLRSDPFSPEPIDNPEALTDVNSPLPDATLTHGLKITSESVDPQESLTLPTIMMPSELEDSGVRTRDLSLDILLPTAIAQSGVDSSLDPEQPEGTAIDITEIRDDEDLTDAIAQPTAESVPLENRTTAVALPSPPVNREAELPPATVVLGITSAPVTLQLDFPEAIELHLSAKETGWTVTAGDMALPIAVFEVNPDGTALLFRWLASAADTPLAQSLVHGRITTDLGEVIYLRAQLDAESIATDIGERDEKLKWMLGGPVLNTSTRLRLSLRVPEDVSVQWIESIEEKSPQRTRGIAILSLTDPPDSGSLAARIDLRASTTLTMRIRYGARLGPGMPWQWTDAKSIRNSLDTTTRQLQIADDQLLQLETAISRAKKLRARQHEVALEIQRDQIEEAVRSGTLIAKRLAELDQLVAILDAEGRLLVNLHVQWPGGEVQTLLSTNDTQ